ncbi:MAG: M28 family peptidase [Gemmatimonadaceae bacterium]
MRRSSALLSSLVVAACVSGSKAIPAAPPAPGPLLGQVAPRYSGTRALETVAFLDQYVRWPGNRGFDASIAHIVERLQQAGYVRQEQAAPDDRLTYRVERYPMPNPAWEPLDAVVTVEGVAEPVLRFATNRNLLATNSWATPAAGVAGELVDAGKGTPTELDAANVRGRIVLANASVGKLFSEAVVKRGALGVLGYNMPAYTQPQVNIHSIQFGGIPYDSTRKAWAIALSYDAHQRLQVALARGPVRVRVVSAVQWTPDATEQTVVAEVRGSQRPDERFVFSAHVQEPGANDNASGVGAQVEMARVTADLVRAQTIDPQRTVTFLWGLEIRSTDRFITQDSARARGIMWGLSLDMVGENTSKTGGTFLIEKMPDPSAIWTRGEDRHSEWGGSPLTKAQMTPHYFADDAPLLQRLRAGALPRGGGNDWLGGEDEPLRRGQ